MTRFNNSPKPFSPVALAAILWAALGLAGGLLSSVAQAQAPLAPGSVPAAKDTTGYLGAQNPLADVIREIDPKNSDDLMFALTIYVRVEDHVRSKPLLKRLLELKLPASTLAGYQRKFGSAMFMQVARTPELQPEGAQFGDAVLNAAYQQARNPDRLKALVNKLYEPSASARGAAIEELKRADEAALQVLLHDLADGPTPEQALRLKQAITAFGEPAVDLVLGALVSTNPVTRTHLSEILARLESDRALPFLIRAAFDGGADPDERQMANVALAAISGARPSRTEALEVLRRRAQAFSRGVPPGRVRIDDTITLWQWTEAKRALAPRVLPAEDAAAVMAARLTADLAALDPSPQVMRLNLAAGFEAAKALAGWSLELPSGAGTIRALARTAGPQQVEQVAAEAMQDRRFGAALGALETLGDFRAEEVLAASDGRPRVLALALRDPNRRIRFTAAMSIMKLSPQRAFPGCSHLPETLATLAGTGHQKRVIIGHPLPAQGQSLVGQFGELGYTGVAAATGRGVFELAVRETDCEFLFLADTLAFPAISETIQALRRDPRTAEIPLALVSQSNNLDSAERFAAESPLVMALPQSETSRLLAYQLRQLSLLSGRRAVTREERLAQASRALASLATLAAEPKTYAHFDLIRHVRSVEPALYVPELTGQASLVLGHLATSEAQRSLVEMASQSTFSLGQREAAAAAFFAAVKRRGVLLTSREISEQYERYNRSQVLDRESQRVLEKLLDAIEFRYQQEQEFKR